MTVHLVGAGPGDPELLTVRALRLLEAADVVVHDRLVDPRILDLIAPWAEVIDVGKRPGGPADAQARIHEMLVLGGEPQDRNWLGLPADAGRLTSRHYFEWTSSAAGADVHLPLTIANLNPPDEPPPPWDDDLVAAAIRRVATHVRSKTIDGPQRANRAAPPDWVGQIPNEFPVPQEPGDIALSAADTHYSLGRWLLGPDEALVVTGRWPVCRFASVCAWNRFLQTLDYVNRPVSRNRATTTLEADGSFRMVVAHADPGVPNWIDTEGRASGTLFFRFFLTEGDIDPLSAEVVPFAEIET